MSFQQVDLVTVRLARLACSAQAASTLALFTGKLRSNRHTDIQSYFQFFRNVIYTVQRLTDIRKMGVAEGGATLN